MADEEVTRPEVLAGPTSGRAPARSRRQQRCRGRPRPRNQRQAPGQKGYGPGGPQIGSSDAPLTDVDVNVLEDTLAELKALREGRETAARRSPRSSGNTTSPTAPRPGLCPLLRDRRDVTDVVRATTKSIVAHQQGEEQSTRPRPWVGTPPGRATAKAAEPRLSWEAGQPPGVPAVGPRRT